MACGEIHQESSSISTITGVAPANKTALIVAAKVKSGTITSSPCLIPREWSAKCKATVPLNTLTPCPTPQYEANASSNCVI